MDFENLKMSIFENSIKPFYKLSKNPLACSYWGVKIYSILLDTNLIHDEISLGTLLGLEVTVNPVWKMALSKMGILKPQPLFGNSHFANGD